MCNVLKINENDNVVVALVAIEKGSLLLIDNKEVIVKESIPFGHKIAINDIKASNKIIKYGNPIAYATKNISIGEHVHSHNAKTTLNENKDFVYNPIKQSHAVVSKKTFLGYKRENGDVGIRNEIWIINTVGCVNRLSRRIENEMQNEIPEGIDGVYSFEHPYGCSQLGDDHKNTQMILKGLVNHPNAAGVLVLGLGCENNNITEFKKVLGNYNKKRVRFLNSQDVKDEVLEGKKLIRNLFSYAKTFKRTPCPYSKLTIGLKCGGSDAFSGITANSLVGKFTDQLVNEGARAVLTEVPEMFGAEHILLNRCVSKSLFNKMVDMINNFKQYFTNHGQPVYENPSPGNKSGGITTLEEKSLGCIQKGGFSPIVDVLKIGDSVNKIGLNVLNGPGNDIVSTTLLAASKAQLILFTTGRGTPLGAVVPTIKISSNSKLSESKSNWIDFDSGTLLNEKNFDNSLKSLTDLVFKTIEGKYTHNEINGYREIAIFKDGVTL